MADVADSSYSEGNGPSDPAASHYDAVIVGGGPVGLVLAIGLSQQHQQDGRWSKILVVEQRSGGDGFATKAWTKSYLIGMRERGIRVLDELDGVVPQLDETVSTFKKAAGDRAIYSWTPTELKRLPGPLYAFSGGGRRYSMQRWQLVEALETLLKKRHSDRVTIVNGAVESIRIPKPDDETTVPGMAETTIVVKQTQSSDVASSGENNDNNGEVKIVARSKFLFGCDGMHSIVRKTLQKEVSQRRFRLRSVSCPSAGLIYRNLLIQAPVANGTVDNEDFVFCHGTTGQSITMLSYTKPDSLYRPIGNARRASYFLYQCKTVEQVYEAMEKEFPQLNARSTISEQHVRDFLEDSKPVVFSRPSWCTSATCLIPSSSAQLQKHKVKSQQENSASDGMVAVALVGDALSHFPPDVGQGFISGLLDVQRLLKALSTSYNGTDESLALAMEQYDKESVKEAEAICRLMPVLSPYQYNIPGPLDQIRKFVHFTDVWIRTKLHNVTQAMGMPNEWFYPPVLTLLTQEEPKIFSYSEIWAQRQWNTRVLQTGASAIALLFATLFWKIFRGQSQRPSLSLSFNDNK
ncbi:hypothetical protein ACA910_010857 [Epithemia clementina (nom. ined.)]